MSPEFGPELPGITEYYVPGITRNYELFGVPPFGGAKS